MNSFCSHERLELALVGKLSPDDEATLHLHLDQCELCAAEMDRLVGGDDVSRHIAAMLTPDNLDEALLLRTECSTADFVVEHLDPSDDPDVLGRLGAYDVLDVIGRGGMGVVLKGFDRELKRFVAIKALAPHLAHSALARKRFAREAQAAAAVVNLHVIAIHQVQPNGQLPFLVMPLLTGESLAQRMTTRGALELPEILRIGMQAAKGLAAAHGQGLVHRDIKPANILLEKGVERAVLTDFGLARAADDVSMTRWGIIAGTPEYMSPEQALGEALDGRSDLFSLGCVLYEMATGVSPFRADSTMATLRRIVDDDPRAIASLAPELPPWFIGIVERLLAKDPTQRFASASEVSELLEQCLSHLQQPSMVPPPQSVAISAVRRSRRTPLIRRLLAAAFALTLSLAGIFVVLDFNMGQLTIECAAVDVPIRIMQGDTVIKKLTVTKSGATVRVAAGRYVVEIDGTADGIIVQNGSVVLQRRGVETVRIMSDAGAAALRSHFPDMTQAIADAILDWVDSDDEQRPYGAESETYRRLHSPFSPSNRPLKQIDELLCIRGVTPELVYGADSNRNGIIDGNERASSDNALGWAGLIRAYQSEPPARNGGVLADVDRLLLTLDPVNPRIDRFAELDTDQDGRLSIAEFGVGRSANHAAKWFGLRDADHNGFLTPEEFVPSSAKAGSKPPAGTMDETGIDRQNARMVVEAYVDAVLDGDRARTQSLATGQPADPEQSETVRRLVNWVHEIAMKSVYVNSPIKPSQALAISGAVKLNDPNDQSEGFVVLAMTMSNAGWVVTDINFESQTGVDVKLRRYREANSNAIELLSGRFKAIQVAPGTDTNDD